jgi:hypothetical protein
MTGAALNIVYLVPFLGRLVREAIEGPEEALLAFIANIVMLLAIAVLLYGFPALITIALSAAGIVLATIIRLTLG